MLAADYLLTFERLKNGQLGLTSIYGSFLAEAASYCLHVNRHRSPGTMSVTGDLRASSILKWDEVKEGDASTYADLEEATEYGAYALAVIVATQLTGFSRVERSAKGTGIYLWLAGQSDGLFFQRAARLEVSGILKGRGHLISTRSKAKLKQTARTDSSLLPAYVAIVEFSLPETRLLKKDMSESPR